MIAIVDYGVGNLFSLRSSLRALGADSLVSGDREELMRADKLILPGVGAFGDAADKLRAAGLDGLLRDRARAGVPLLGVCLGMQLLFDESLEYGRHAGLGLIPGRVVPISGLIPDGLKIPHIGWNALAFPRPHPLFAQVEEGAHVYFVHSYAAVDCADALIAQTEYGAPLTAAVARENVMGCQFHPEKSGSVGLRILKAFCDMGGR